jgi:hypothetical protein
VHLDTEPAESIDVDRADETGADDGGADLVERFHLRGPHEITALALISWGYHMYQFRCDLPCRADGASFGVERPPAHATQLAIARCTSGW